MDTIQMMHAGQGDSDTVRSAIWRQIGRKLIEPDQRSERSRNCYDQIINGNLTLFIAQSW